MTKWENIYAKAEDDKILEVNGEEVGAFQGLPIRSAERPSVSEFFGKSRQESWEFMFLASFIGIAFIFAPFIRAFTGKPASS